ncbi:hypothetical protein ACFP1Z_05415 [Streptomyces gamaensis]|uniref:Uncharacterized protein n=1 Tax=Streptomyces gamaensis TaxID=1763542 RepID=A0ABW0YVR6_9ACTN
MPPPRPPWARPYRPAEEPLFAEDVQLVRPYVLTDAERRRLRDTPLGRPLTNVPCRHLAEAG